MIKIKKITFLLLILFLSIENSNSNIEDSLFISVGNVAITRSDIIKEIKLILILNGQVYSEDNKKNLEKSAVNSVIKRTIKNIEIEKNGITEFNSADLFNEVNKLASSANMNLDNFKKVLEKNQISYKDLTNNIKTEIIWNGLIFNIYKDRVSINEEEIEDQLNLIQSKSDIEEYLLSEIIIKSVSSGEVELKIKEIKERINNEGFIKIAKELSISESAVKGGDIGWLNENIIHKKYKDIIRNTEVGKISKPIVIKSGILIFKVRDKRRLKKKLSKEEIKNQLMQNEKQKILNMYSLSHYDNLKRNIAIDYF